MDYGVGCDVPCPTNIFLVVFSLRCLYLTCSHDYCHNDCITRLIIIHQPNGPNTMLVIRGILNDCFHYHVYT